MTAGIAFEALDILALNSFLFSLFNQLSLRRK
jgi:hypothetical protein